MASQAACEHGAIVHECSVSSQLVPHLHHSDLAPLLGEEHTGLYADFAAADDDHIAGRFSQRS